MDFNSNNNNGDNISKCSKLLHTSAFFDKLITAPRSTTIVNSTVTTSHIECINHYSGLNVEKVTNLLSAISVFQQNARFAYETKLFIQMIKISYGKIFKTTKSLIQKIKDSLHFQPNLRHHRFPILSLRGWI